MTPIKLLGLTSNQDSFKDLDLNIFELSWAKFGLFLLLLIAVKVLHEIITKHSSFSSPKQDRNVFRLFFLSPIALFSLAAMGQYDVIAILLILVGFRAWLQQENKKFLFAFALAITFKYFALLVFLPLIFIRFRKLSKATACLVAVMVPTFLLFCIYINSEAFRENALNTPIRVLIGNGSSQTTFIKLLIAIAILAMIYAFTRKLRAIGYSEFDTAINTIVILFAVAFTFIRWNPQWLLFALPFWVMLQIRESKSRALISMEIVAFLGIVWMVATVWANKLDQSLVIYGPFASQLQNHTLTLADFFRPEFLWIGVILAQGSIIAPGAYVLFQTFRSAATSNNIPQNRAWLEFLKPTSFLLLYIVPILLCLVVPSSVASRISQQVDANLLSRSASNQFHSKLITLTPGQSVSQISEFDIDGIRGLGLDVHLTDKVTLGDFNLTISRLDGTDSFPIKLIPPRADNSFLGFIGWTEFTFLIGEGKRLGKGPINLTLTNRSDYDVGVWVDTIRPSKSKLFGVTGEPISGSLVKSIYF
jgi:hypothetical protein